MHKLAFTFPSESSSGSDVTALKEAIYQITGVPSDRMKLMLKTGLVKESTDLRKSLSNNPLVTVIGSAGPLPQAPTEAPKFLEDMTDKELAIAAGGGAGGLHPGLVNLGNTCYMNASLQAMKTIPELRTALDRWVDSPFSVLSPSLLFSSVHFSFASTLLFFFFFVFLFSSFFSGSDLPPRIPSIFGYCLFVRVHC